MLMSEDVPGPPRFTVLQSDEKLGVGLGMRLLATYLRTYVIYEFCIIDVSMTQNP